MKFKYKIFEFFLEKRKKSNTDEMPEKKNVQYQFCAFAFFPLCISCNKLMVEMFEVLTFM